MGKMKKLICILLVLITFGCHKKDAISFYNENPYNLLITVADFKSGCYADENLKNSVERLYKSKGNERLDLRYNSIFRNNSTRLSMTIHNIITISKTDSETQNDYKEYSDVVNIVNIEVNNSVVTKNDLSDILKFGKSTFIEYINKEQGIKTYAFVGIKQNKFVVFSISGCLNRDSVTNKLRTQINKIDSL